MRWQRRRDSAGEQREIDGFGLPLNIIGNGICPWTAYPAAYKQQLPLPGEQPNSRVPRCGGSPRGCGGYTRLRVKLP